MNATWSVSSKDGWNRATVSIFDRIGDAGETAKLVGSLEIRSLFWDRADVARSGTVDAVLVEDLSACVPQVLVGLGEVSRLAAHMRRWLTDYSEFEIDLAVESNQQLSFSVGRREELICKPECPAMTVRYQGERVGTLEVHFLVDQTCISATLEELNQLLSVK